MKTTPLLLAALLGLTMPLALAPASPAQAATPAAAPTLPALGDAGGDELGLGAERRLGERIMKELRRDPDLLDDPLLQDYVDSLWQPLLAAARARGDLPDEQREQFAWATFLVRDRSVNAFALPGGHVGVHLGLIAITSTRDELAAVLAHELSHVTQRHIARSIATSRRQSLIGAATMIAGILAASRSGDAANAMIVGGQAVAAQGQLNFSRDMEREADRIGFQLLTGAGFAPSGMAAMFEKLDQASRLNDSGGYPYLRSHPLTSERIGEARSRLGTEQAAPAPGRSSGLEHAFAMARSRVLMDTRVDALRRWQAQDAPRSDLTASQKLADLYSSALASVLLRDTERADGAIARLQSLLADSPRSDAKAARWTVMLKGEALLARGDATGALATLAPLSGDLSRPALLLNAEVALAGAGGAPAVRRIADELQTRVALHPGDATAWAMLGRLWAKAGEPLRSRRAEGEAAYALGDLRGAIDRFRAGQGQVRPGNPADFIEASVIDSRLREVQAQLRAFIAEQQEQQQR